MSEINVTPLVDVMMVLLVIFMVTAPLSVAGVDVNLPQNRAKHLQSDNPPIELSIDPDGKVFVGDSPVEPKQLGAVLQARAATMGGVEAVRVFVRADRTLDYGSVMEIVGEVAAAGFVKVAFLSDPRRTQQRGGRP